MLLLRSLSLGVAALAMGAGPLSARAQDAFVHPADAAPERQFDFWVGEWDITNRRLQPDGSWQEFPASAKIWAALDGQVIVEHWASRTDAWPMRGFSMRAYDPATELWTIVLCWPDPFGDSANFGFMEGRFRNGRGEFFPQRQLDAGEEPTVRFTFSDAGPKSLRWDQAMRTDDGAWRTTWIMEWERRGEDAPLDMAWVHGDARTSDSVGETDLLSRLEGQWSMTDFPAEEAKSSRPYEYSPVRFASALNGRGLILTASHHEPIWVPGRKAVSGSEIVDERIGLLIRATPTSYSFCEYSLSEPAFETFEWDTTSTLNRFENATRTARQSIRFRTPDQLEWDIEQMSGGSWAPVFHRVLERRD